MRRSEEGSTEQALAYITGLHFSHQRGVERLMVNEFKMSASAKFKCRSESKFFFQIGRGFDPPCGQAARVVAAAVPLCRCLLAELFCVLVRLQ